MRVAIGSKNYTEVFGHTKAVKGFFKSYGGRTYKKSNLFIIEDIKSFITENITGEPLRVKSRRHKKEVLKKHGLIESPGYKGCRRKNRGNRTRGLRKMEWR